MTVLFVIMAITVISLGLFARTDMHLACAKNFTIRVQIDALAYSGLECARALVVDPNLIIPLSSPVTLPDLDSSLHCDLEIGNPDGHTYPVTCKAYRQVDTEVLAQSILSGNLLYDPNDLPARYLSIERVR